MKNTIALIVADHLKNVEEHGFCVCSFFSFRVPRKGTTNNHLNGSSDISCRSRFGHDLNAIKKCPKIEIFSVSRKIGLKFLIFRLTSSE